MHRPGSDPDNMLESDFLCDFCGQHWTPARPMVEGHKGSLICGKCLTLAYTQVVVQNAGVSVPEHVSCALCLLNKSGDYWQSPVLVRIDGTGRDATVDITAEPGACACKWCIERSAKILSRDPAAAWTLPA